MLYQIQTGKKSKFIHEEVPLKLVDGRWKIYYPEIIRSNKTIHKLNLSKNHFGPVSTQEISRSLMTNKSLEELDYSMQNDPKHPGRGIGEEEYIDLNKLIGDENKTLREGAIVTTLPNGYIVYSQVTVEELNKVCQAHGLRARREALADHSYHQGHGQGADVGDPKHPQVQQHAQAQLHDREARRWRREDSHVLEGRR